MNNQKRKVFPRLILFSRFIVHLISFYKILVKFIFRKGVYIFFSIRDIIFRFFKFSYMLPYKDRDILYLQNKEFEENVKYSFSNDNFFLAKFFLRCIIGLYYCSARKRKENKNSLQYFTRIRSR